MSQHAIARRAMKLSLKQDVHISPMNPELLLSDDGADDDARALGSATRLLYPASALADGSDLFLNFEPER